MNSLDDLILEAVFQPQQQNLFSGSLSSPEETSSKTKKIFTFNESIREVSDPREIQAIHMHESGKSEDALFLLDQIISELPSCHSALNNK